MSVKQETPAYRSEHLWIYELVAYPGSEVEESLRSEWKEVAGRWEAPEQDRPHIPLLRFEAKEALEETLIRWMGNICRLQQGPVLQVNNYSSLPPHTVFARIPEGEAFAQLINQFRIIDGFLQSNGCPPLQLHTKPFLTVATGLSPAAYEEAVYAYARKTFHALIPLNRLTLVRKGWEGGSFGLVHTFFLSSSRN